MNRERLDDAVRFAQAHEIAWPRDPHAAPAPGQVQWGVHQDDPPPYDRLFGPVHARGPQSGVVLRNGAQLASWGEPGRADLTFSVAKTYLALLAGVAHADGLLPDPDQPVVKRLPGIGFDSAHNRPITWTHLLTQTSEWEGTCFGIPDTVDRWRKVAQDPRPAGGPKGGARPLQTPGTYWEYNDVRINQLSLALLHLFRRPLERVFLERILKPIGAGEGFRWVGYDDAWVVLPGVGRVPSVPGGSHWGAGVSISAIDQAGVGQLMLDRGLANGRALVPKAWIDAMGEPCAVAPFYGRLVWLNRGGKAFPGASTQALLMLGAGGHVTWIEPALNAVVVLRWFDNAHLGAAMTRFAEALRGG
jgi:CubicO group peptidase (beta-lactamase class C family)